MDLTDHFPGLTDLQRRQFAQLPALYELWNARINLISRKDIDELFTRHILHSLAIAKVQAFLPGSDILDVGTGGGFPGIPLAILFPEVRFRLIDAIGKKITVVKAVTDALGLENVSAEQLRAENDKGRYDFIVSRAVTNMDDFVGWVRHKVKKESRHELHNGILYLKGGDLSEKLQHFPKAQVFDIQDFFGDSFFETKKVVHIPLKYKP